MSLYFNIFITNVITTRNTLCNHIIQTNLNKTCCLLHKTHLLVLNLTVFNTPLPLCFYFTIIYLYCQYLFYVIIMFL